MDPTLYQYCQKIVLFRNNGEELLLARRSGEADMDDVYTFIGGKLETTDGSLLNGLKRERNEEVGAAVKVRICPHTSYNVYFVKQSGQHMIVPHYYAEYVEGDISLSDEYDDYQWIKLTELQAFQPKVDNLYDIAQWALKLKANLSQTDLVTI